MNKPVPVLPVGEKKIPEQQNPKNPKAPWKIHKSESVVFQPLSRLKYPGYGSAYSKRLAASSYRQGFVEVQLRVGLASLSLQEQHVYCMLFAFVVYAFRHRGVCFSPSWCMLFAFRLRSALWKNSSCFHDTEEVTYQNYSQLRITSESSARTTSFF